MRSFLQTFEATIAACRGGSEDSILINTLQDFIDHVEGTPWDEIGKLEQRMEKLLNECVVLGTSVLVRKLIARAYVVLYTANRRRKMYGIADVLQPLFAKNSAVDAKLCALHCLGEVARHVGRNQTSLVGECVEKALKLVKHSDAQVRNAAVEALERACHGAPALHVVPHETVLKVLGKMVSDKHSNVRLSVARACVPFATLVAKKPPALEGVLKHCHVGMEDAVEQVRNKFAQCAGHVLALVLGEDNQARASRARAASSKRKHTLSDQSFAGVANSLSAQFARASTSIPMRSALTHCYMHMLLQVEQGVAEENASFVVAHMIGMIANPKVFASPLDAMHGRTCIAHALKFGLSVRLTENSLNNMLKDVCAQLKDDAHVGNSVVLVCCLDVITFLLQRVGEALVDVIDPVREAVTHHLGHPLESVRVFAAGALRLLVTALPSQLVGLLSSTHNIILIAHAELDVVSKRSLLRATLAKLHGHACAQATMFAVLPQFPLQVTYAVPEAALELAVQLITAALEKTDNLNVLHGRLEAGWIILSGLMALGESWVGTKLSKLFALWNNVLKKPTGNLPHDEEGLVSFLAQRACAHEALLGFVARCPSLVAGVVKKSVYAFVLHSHTFVTAIPAGIPDSSALVRDSIRQTKMVLMRTVLAIHKASGSVNAKLGFKMLHLAVSELSDGCANGMLQGMLHAEDSMLGPWVDMREPLEQELQRLPDRTEVDSAQLWAPTFACSAELQCLPLGARVVDAAIDVFRMQFVVQKDHIKQGIMENLVARLKAPPTKTAKVNSAFLRNAATAVLASTQEMAARMSSASSLASPPAAPASPVPAGEDGAAGGGVSPNMGTKKSRAAARSIALKCLSDVDVCVRRAGAQILGVLARVSEDDFTRDVVLWVDKQVKKKAKDENACACLSFVLGCIHRSVGGIKSHTWLDTSVRSLFLLVGHESSLVQRWTLHALRLVIEACGGVYYQHHIKPTFDCLYRTLTASTAHMLGSPAMVCVGRVVNSLVSALGPEVGMQDAYRRACFVIAELLKSREQPRVQVEVITLYGAILTFAPRAINLPMLLAFVLERLRSWDAGVRIASVGCLRELLERNMDSLKGKRLEEDLFLMLDSEMDDAAASKIKMTLSLMMDTLAPRNPVKWIHMLREVVLSASAWKATQPAALEGLKDDEDDDDNDDGGGGRGGPGGSGGVTFRARWRTKLFALECMQRVLQHARSDPLHRDLEKARAARQELLDNGQREDAGRFIVLALDDVVSLAFKCATSTHNSLRLVGVQTLKDVIAIFRDARDPHFEGHALLEQYQAQFTSALRPAMAQDAPPELTAAACELALLFVTSHITDDASACGRMIAQLTDPLASLQDSATSLKKQNILNPDKSEQACAVVHLSLLSTVARVYAAAGPELLQAVQPSLPRLIVYWAWFLHDHSALSMYHRSLSSYAGHFFTPSTIPQLLPSLDASWPHVLRAMASLAGSDVWKAQSSEAAVVTRQQGDVAVDTFFLCMGKCMHALTRAHPPHETMQCVLAALQALLYEGVVEENALDRPLCEELLELLATQLVASNTTIQEPIVGLIHRMVTVLPADSHVLPMSNAIIQALFRSVNANLPELNSNAGAAAVVGACLSVLTVLAHKVPVTAMTILPTMFQMDEHVFAGTNADVFRKLLVALQSLVKAGEKLVESDGAAWSQNYHATLSSALLLLDGGTTPGDDVRRHVLLCMGMLLGGVPAVERLPLELYERVRSVLATALCEGTNPVAAAALQALRTVLQQERSKALALSLVRELGRDVVAFVRKPSHATDDGAAAALTEAVKLLLLVYANAGSSSAPFLSLIIPLLIGMLRVPAVAELALQSVLSLAKVGGDVFKQVLEAQPADTRAALESAVRESVAKQQASQASQAAARKPVRKHVPITKTKPKIQLKASFANFGAAK